MSELPLFPLHTVLFPHTPVHLHIFEERYKRLIGMCLEEKRPFGVVLIRRGSEARGPLPVPYQVGCSALITQTRQLEDGRINLTAMGSERFRILSLDSNSQPYLVGEVEAFPWQIVDRRRLADLALRLLGQMEAYLRLMSKAGGSRAGLDLQRLPRDPLEAACVAAAVLPADPRQKQALLEKGDAEEFVELALRCYRREQALLRAEIAHGERAGNRPFSNN